MFNKKTVKLSALILALVMVFALALTGCGKKTVEDDEDTSSQTSSTPAPSKPAINEEATEILDKYEFEIPEAKSKWFSDMEYVSIINEDDGIVYFEMVGYKGEEIKRYVSMLAGTRAALVENEYISEDTDEAIEEFFDLLDDEDEGRDFVTFYFDKDDKNFVMARIVERNEEVNTYIFESSVSDFVAEGLEYGGVLEFGEKSDYVKEDDTSSNDSNDNNSGGGEAVEVTREENPAYSAVFAKYGFSEPNVMAGGEFNVVVVDGGKDGVEVNYYFAKPTGEVVSFLSYNIMKRADFVEEMEVQDDDSMIELVLETTAQLMNSTYGVDLDYSFNETTVTMSISTTANNSELEVDCIGKQLRDVVADDVADDGVQKYFD